MAVTRVPKIDWTEERRAELKALLGTMPVEDIAKTMNLTTCQVMGICKREKWSFAYYRKIKKVFTPEQCEYIREWAGIKSAPDIASDLELKANQIHRKASYMGLSTRIRKGLPSHIAAEDFPLILALRADGMGLLEIAKKFEISVSLCKRICSGELKPPAAPN